MDSDVLILPGRCIGKLCLDDAKSMVRAKLGSPAFNKALFSPSEVGMWSVSESRKVDHIFITYFKGRVADIHITSDLFKTKDGISTLSKFNDVRAAYPSGEEVPYAIFESAHNRVDWIVKEQGITFSIAKDTEGPIIRIAIHKIGKAKAVGYSDREDWYWYPNKQQ